MTIQVHTNKFKLPLHYTFSAWGLVKPSSFLRIQCAGTGGLKHPIQPEQWLCLMVVFVEICLGDKYLTAEAGVVSKCTLKRQRSMC